MKRISLTKPAYCLILCVVVLFAGMFTYGADAYAEKECDPNQTTIFGLPTWYKYLGGTEVEKVSLDGTVGTETVCQPLIWTRQGEKLPKRDILLIAGAIMDMLTRIAGLAAFIYLIYGGFLYLTSSGNSESVKKAGSTLLNAAIGLAIAISATTIINYFAKQLTK